MHETTKKGIALALAFELAMHILVHYTMPGMQAASWVAEAISPALDSVGLTTVFSESAGIANAALTVPDNALPALEALVP